MRLIDADTLYAALMEKSDAIARGTGRNCLALSCKAVAAMVQEAPTIDAVQVVRCKDCEHAHMTIGGECKDCDEWEEDEPLYLDGDFFCAFGQRKAEP